MTTVPGETTAIRVGLGLLLLALVTAGGAHAREVVFPDFRGRVEEDVFAYAVLREALRRAPGDYELTKSSRPEMTNARALVELERGRVDVLWVGTSPDLEARFRPIYIPVTRGLLGHRFFVIRNDRQGEFSAVDDIVDLRGFTGGQGTGWTDTAILQESGLDIVTASFDDLFQLVQNGRVDYYPLGASEIYGFLDDYRQAHPDLIVEEDLVVIYPFDFLFFVNEGDTELYEAIRTGMEKMYADGTYLEMFRTHPELRPYHERGDLGSRRRIRIPNPFATPEFNRIPDRYWLEM